MGIPFTNLYKMSKTTIYTFCYLSSYRLLDTRHSKTPNMANKLSLKLLIDRKSQKVLFAEAEKEFIDFLLSLLTLPVGSVVKLLKKNFMVGCIGKLYESIENLSDTYIQTGQTRNMLLNPISPSAPYSPLLLQNDAKAKSMMFYTCTYNHRYITDFSCVRCPQCNGAMTTEHIYVANDGVSSSSVGSGGFVKGVVTYTVMDDLVGKPMSTISCIALLNRFDVRDVGSLEESVDEIGFNEVWH